MNEFIRDVFYSSKGTLKKLGVQKGLEKKEIVIVSPEHEAAAMIAGTIADILADRKIPMSLVLEGTEPSDVWEVVLAQNPGIRICSTLKDYMAAKTAEDTEKNKDKGKKEKDPSETKEPVYDAWFMVFANLRDPRYTGEKADEDRKAKLNQIDRILSICQKHEGWGMQLVTCIPAISKPLPKVTNAVAEREYEVIFRDYPEESAEKFVLRMEKEVRRLSQKYEITDHVQVIRLDRVFGPGISGSDDLPVISVLQDIAKKKSVDLYDGDRYDYFSASYIKDAVVGIILALYSGRKGNIYHVSTWEMNRMEIITTLYGELEEVPFVINTVHDEEKKDYQLTYRILNARKLRLTHKSNLNTVLKTTKLSALRNTANWVLDNKDYTPHSDVNVYFGRMDRIREIELDILNEVDKICKENNIPYFLTAGTMLGAVRHKGFIPWDDDVDLGMLPEDYDRFLKICPESLAVEFGYQNVSTEKESHYIHDKIRLKNSFFSTKYSDRYQMLNGVYIDVFVYYKTSDSPAAQKRHIRQAEIMRTLIGIRWAINKKKRIIYRLAFDVTHKFPSSWFDKYYRHVLMKYNKKNTHYRIDGGFNLTKAGAVPDEWFHGTVEAEFCGRKYPILAHYNDFLSHWYGEHYMELLPLSSRQSVHDVVRIDLGQNLFDETSHDARFRDVDIRGELFEVEKTQAK